jgi:hypothetical protein
MNADKNTVPNETPTDNDKASVVLASRRKAMMKMAAYTAPVLLTVLTSQKAVAVSGGGYWKHPTAS